jgi:hypothetical protein
VKSPRPVMSRQAFLVEAPHTLFLRGDSGQDYVEVRQTDKLSID